MKKHKLAIEGGKSVSSKPFPMWPSFQSSTIQKAMQPLKSGKVNYWTGEAGIQFEKEWAKWNGVSMPYQLLTAPARSMLLWHPLELAGG